MRREDAPELWGGVECTVARLRGRVRDQVRETGHRDRPDDLDRIAALGIRTLRYPVLWETIAPTRPDRPRWAWHDARLGRLRELGIRPIAGLLHHGGGPLYTDLLDPAFPELFARHARAVARRYPWLELYTPINEPLTTARFSCLYGHWHPHRRDLPAFLRAVVNQCRATVLAMREIRRVNPAAQLVQTDDVGRTFAPPRLAAQAEHENGRRWLAFDLLFGQVGRRHSWWRILRENGIGEDEIAAFRDGEGRPDLVGMNHYLTSERWLDPRVDRYPARLAGGNGREVYADAEAVRARAAAGLTGPEARLRETWTRYRVPVAVTEVHHGSTPDEQLRWLAETWRAACRLRQEGADIRAVTLWALFGAVDWDTLLVRERGSYESGAWDVRGAEPRPTALAIAAASLAARGDFAHPVLDVEGWWRRPDRFYGAGRGLPRRSPIAPAIRQAAPSIRQIAILPPAAAGGSGALAILRLVLGVASVRGLACEVIGPDAVRRGQMPADTLRRARAWALLDLHRAYPGGRVAGPGGPARDALVRAARARGLPVVRVGPAGIARPSERRLNRDLAHGWFDRLVDGWREP